MILKTNNLQFFKYGIEEVNFNFNSNKNYYEFDIYENTSYNFLFYNTNYIYIELIDGMVLLDICNFSNNTILNIETYYLYKTIKLNPKIHFNFHCVSKYGKIRMYSKEFINIIHITNKINYNKITPLFEINELLGIIYNVKNNSYTSNEEFHDFWELNYIDMGETTITLNNQNFISKKGQLIIFAPYEKHKIDTKNLNKSCSYVTILFKSRNLTRNLLKNTNLPLNNEDYIILKNIIDLSSQNNLFSNNKIINYLEILITNLIDYKKNSSNIINLKINQQSYENELINEIINYIKNNLDKENLIQEIQKNFYISNTTLLNYFHKYIKTSPKNYIIKQKMKKAKELMFEKNITITEISNILGYSSVNYFSKAFKDYYGYPPSKFSSSIHK